jgi:type IV fimbrial biogenesis protein FimT
MADSSESDHCDLRVSDSQAYSHYRRLQTRCPHHLAKVCAPVFLTEHAMKGFSLVELLVVLVISAILASQAFPFAHHLITQSRIKGATSEVLRAIQMARTEAIGKGTIYLCDDSVECKFDHRTRQLLVLLDRADTRDFSRMELLASVDMPNNTYLSWRRFRGDALAFRANGLAYFQNGHFLVCHQNRGRKVVVNWVGRPRVEQAPDGACPAAR